MRPNVHRDASGYSTDGSCQWIRIFDQHCNEAIVQITFTQKLVIETLRLDKCIDAKICMCNTPSGFLWKEVPSNQCKYDNKQWNLRVRYESTTSRTCLVEFPLPTAYKSLWVRHKWERTPMTMPIVKAQRFAQNQYNNLWIWDQDSTLHTILPQ